MLAELGAAVGARDHDRLEAAARYLHAVGTPLVEIYEALLARLVDFGPEWIRAPAATPSARSAASSTTS